MVWLLSGWLIFLIAWSWFGYERFINQSNKKNNGWLILFAIQVLGIITMFVLQHFPLFFAISLGSLLFVRNYFKRSFI